MQKNSKAKNKGKVVKNKKNKSQKLPMILLIGAIVLIVAGIGGYLLSNKGSLGGGFNVMAPQPYDGGGGKVICNVQNCNKCSRNNYCSSCRSGYTLSKGKCLKKCQSVTYCTSYDQTETNCTCKTCENNKALAANKLKCCDKIANCAKYDSSSCKCIACQTNSTLKDGKCVTNQRTFGCKAGVSPQNVCASNGLKYFSDNCTTTQTKYKCAKTYEKTIYQCLIDDSGKYGWNKLSTTSVIGQCTSSNTQMICGDSTYSSLKTICKSSYKWVKSTSSTVGQTSCVEANKNTECTKSNVKLIKKTCTGATGTISCVG